MKIALISDIHANEAALRAVLDDARRAGVDQVICLGDVATLGPRPRAVLQMLRELDGPCILGNHDEFMLDPQLIHTYTEAPVVVQAVDWCRERLTPEDLDFIRTFKRSLRIPMEGGTELFVFHGSPRSHMQDLLATMPPDELDHHLNGERATVMACGHTHLQMLRQHQGMLLVNPGSVGQPFKEHVHGRAPTLLGHAEYATVESVGPNVSVTLRRVAVDKRAHREAVEATDHPLRAGLLEQYG